MENIMQGPTRNAIKLKELISDEELCQIFQNSNFGGMTNRNVIRYGLLKFACGYRTGNTIKSILVDLGLIYQRKEKHALTNAGKEYLFESFSNDISV